MDICLPFIEGVSSVSIFNNTFTGMGENKRDQGMAEVCNY